MTTKERAALPAVPWWAVIGGMLLTVLSAGICIVAMIAVGTLIWRDGGAQQLAGAVAVALVSAWLSRSTYLIVNPYVEARW